MILKDGETSVEYFDRAKDVILERIRRVATEKISMTQMWAVEELPKMGDYIGYKLVTEVMGEEIDKRDEDVYFSYPATWWDHFKQTYFSGWLLRKFPVRLKTEKKVVHFKQYATYPELPKVYPNAGKIVIRNMIWSTNG